MTKNPMVTVVVPVYNLENYIAATIESVRRQTFGDFEVIIVDDGSRDNSAERARAAAADDGRFRVISQENRGEAGARATGIENARGSWLCFLDGDDTLEPDYLQRLADAARECECDIVCCNGLTRVCNTYTSVIRENRHEDFEGYGFLQALLLRRLSVAGVCGKLYRRKLLDGLHHYQLRVGTDVMTNLQVASRMPRVHYIDYAGYNYLQRGDSAIHLKFDIERCLQFNEAVDDFFSRNREVARAAGAEELNTVNAVWMYCRYIERSSNRWIGGSPTIVALREKSERYRQTLRENLPAADRLMFSLDRMRLLRPAVLVVSTLRRWKTSIARRLSKR